MSQSQLAAGPASSVVPLKLSQALIVAGNVHTGVPAVCPFTVTEAVLVQPAASVAVTEKVTGVLPAARFGFILLAVELLLQRYDAKPEVAVSCTDPGKQIFGLAGVIAT